MALVTGATDGIGLSIKKTLAYEWAKVILNGRTKERVDASAQPLIRSTLVKH
ncbi:SDR family NAD(P)-dependent oxidoreductase [Spirosoma flavus]